MIKKHPDGKYLPTWRDLVAKGRARKRATRPKRDILAVQTALNTLKVRYCQEISFWNAHHRGKHGDLEAGLQWLDFVVRPKGKRTFVVILDDPMKRWKSYEKEYHKNKQLGLQERGIQFLILPKGLSSQEYWIKISWFMKKK